MVALVAATVSLLAVASGSAAPCEKPAPPARPDLPVRADRAGDEVFDDPQVKLANATPGAEVPVIVSRALRPRPSV